MTKTEIRNRVRGIRSTLAGVVDLQDPKLRGVLSSLREEDPDYVAFNALLLARVALSKLIEDLRRDGYGQEASR